MSLPYSFDALNIDTFNDNELRYHTLMITNCSAASQLSQFCKNSEIDMLVTLAYLFSSFLFGPQDQTNYHASMKFARLFVPISLKLIIYSLNKCIKPCLSISLVINKLLNS
jgi:hypothetical protein